MRFKRCKWSLPLSLPPPSPLAHHQSTHAATVTGKCTRVHTLTVTKRHNAAMQKGIHFIAAIRGGARTITQGFFRCWDRCSGRCHRMHVRDIFQRSYWKRRRREDVSCFCYVLKLKLNVEDNVFGVRDATESSRDSSRCGHQHAHRGCLALSD
jgi:hypothetical protein